MAESHSTTVERQLIEDYLTKKLRWNKVKSDYFISHNRITSLSQFITHELPAWEASILQKTKAFLEFCQFELDNDAGQ